MLAGRMSNAGMGSRGPSIVARALQPLPCASALNVKESHRWPAGPAPDWKREQKEKGFAFSIRAGKMQSMLLNPKKWRFTWEALTHIPTLRLFLFNSETNPLKQCRGVKSSLNLERSLVLVSWFEEIGEKTANFVLEVPLPGVLIDPTSSLCIRALGDHIEVKLVLLLPVDHPLVANRELASDLEAAKDDEKMTGFDLDFRLPLPLESDLKRLSSGGDVHFYCRNCSTRITKEPISSFVEMPSVNWREVADNWFGGCCCSFGGISEKLVTKYANSYYCTSGTCFLDDTSVIISKDDLSECLFQDSLCNNLVLENLNSSSLKEKSCGTKLDEEVVEDQNSNYGSSTTYSISAKHSLSMEDHHHCCIHNTETSSLEAVINQSGRFNKGPLGSSFIINSTDLSNDVHWVEFLCSQCSFPLGSYPSAENWSTPLDGGIRLFKCYISTTLPAGGSDDIFRKHTLQRVFVGHLVKSADDELSFRTIVKDMRTKSVMLQIVLLNSKVWCCTGKCYAEKTEEFFSEINLLPVVKLLFSNCSMFTGAEVREVEEWARKGQANEIYMMSSQINELILSLKSAQKNLPNSCSSFQGLAVSFLET